MGKLNEDQKFKLEVVLLFFVTIFVFVRSIAVTYRATQLSMMNMLTQVTNAANIAFTASYIILFAMLVLLFELVSGISEVKIFNWKIKMYYLSFVLLLIGLLCLLSYT